MEENLKIMIERFFNAELSAEEERELCCFLREHNVPDELRKDKETIIALCGEDTEIDLPAGAEARLEEMLDSLAEDEERLLANERSAPKIQRRILGIPRFVWHSAATAAMLVLCYLLVNNKEQVPVHHSGQTADIIQITFSEPEAYEIEENTFDNPEDAMRCFKAAMSEIQLAFITTEKNTQEIGKTLTKAFQPYKNIIKINM